MLSPIIYIIRVSADKSGQLNGHLSIKKCSNVKRRYIITITTFCESDSANRWMSKHDCWNVIVVQFGISFTIEQSMCKSSSSSNSHYIQSTVLTVNNLTLDYCHLKLTNFAMYTSVRTLPGVSSAFPQTSPSA